MNNGALKKRLQEISQKDKAIVGQFQQALSFAQHEPYLKRCILLLGAIAEQGANGGLEKMEQWQIQTERLAEEILKSYHEDERLMRDYIRSVIAKCEAHSKRVKEGRTSFWEEELNRVEKALK